MRTRFDQFAKQLLVRALSEAGTVEAGRETTAEPQLVDVWFEPAPDATGARGHLGALGLLTEQPCLIEPFRKPPSADEVLGCIAKQLALHAERRRSSADARNELPHLWILSAGRPDAAIDAFGLAQAAQAPGLYGAARGFRLHLVVISALPRGGATLLLRLLGAGRTFAGALDELISLPHGAWEKAVALPLLVRLRFEVAAMKPTDRTDEEERILRAHQAFEDFERQAIEKGIAQGIKQGVAQGVAVGLERRFTRRLGRPLTDAEQASWQARLATLGPDRLDDIVLDSSPEDLARWLADPEAQ